MESLSQKEEEEKKASRSRGAGESKKEERRAETLAVELKGKGGSFEGRCSRDMDDEAAVEHGQGELWGAKGPNLKQLKGMGHPRLQLLRHRRLRRRETFFPSTIIHHHNPRRPAPARAASLSLFSLLLFHHPFGRLPGRVLDAPHTTTTCVCSLSHHFSLTRSLPDHSPSLYYCIPNLTHPPTRI